VGQRLSKVRKPGDMFIVFQGKSIPIISRITVGRDADNTIKLEDVLASRHHAVIQKVKEEFFIEDLHSTNGTFVNAQPVPPGKYMRLHPADVILIGRTELSLQRCGITAP
jgi:pSer/pThr/pTyr-binding forkhead associated (FHA) protein